ncbi:hypothetical protein B0H21DRAFT_726006 [Amylocystis lapponica]|nr:hypothetical protein B0H21DRAFT_726006 [Amylocystis lapponica]
MAPPVFGRKPEAKKAEVHKDEADASAEAHPIASPPTGASPNKPSAEGSTDYFESKDPSSLLTPDSSSATSVRSPSMPVPVVPRRAAPPRKRPAKSPSPAAPVGESLEESPSPLPTPALESAAVELPVEPAAQPSEVVVEHVEVVPQDANIVETGLAQSLTEESPATGIHPDVTESETLVVEHPEAASVIADTEEQTKEHIVEGTLDEETPVPVAAEQVEVADEEEDGIARRKRIAERLAKSGGINPLSGHPLPSSPPPVNVERRQSYRRDSRDSEVLSPSSPAEVPMRRGSTESTRARLQPTSPGGAEAPSTPPVLPTSPKPESLGRKGSLGSVRSGGGVEPPTRKMSQDDQRTVLSIPALSEEPYEAQAPEALERSREDAEAAPHGTHEAAHDLQSVLEEEESRRGYEPGDDQTGDRDSAPEEVYEEDDNQSAYSDSEVPQDQSVVHENYAHSPASVEVPPPSSPPSRPVHAPVIDVPPPPPPVLASVRPPVKKPSLPPPPREPPAPPRDEVSEEASEAMFSPPTRNASLPLIPPEPIPRNIVQAKSGYVNTSVPVTKKSFDTEGSRRSLSPPLDYPPEEALDSGSASYEDDNPEYRDGDTASSSVARAEDVLPSEETDIQEEAVDDFPPPPPPPRRVSVPVPPPVAPDNDVRPSPQSSLPPPPERKPRPVSRVPGLETRMSTQMETAAARNVKTPLPPLATRPREAEVLDDSDVDPIDPAFFSPQRSAGELAGSPTSVAADSVVSPISPADASAEPGEEPEEDPEQARRRTIAERMAKLGGIRFGGPPAPMRRPQPPPSAEQEGVESPVSPAAAEQDPEAQEPPEEEDEFARKQRIAARIAGMGGMRFGMVPSAAAPPRAPREHHEEAEHVQSPPPPPQHPLAVPPRPPVPVTKRSEPEPEELGASDGEQVEPEESEAEEVTREEIEEEAPPPVPSRGGRRTSAFEPARPPPVPQGSRPPVPVVSPRMSRPPAPVEQHPTTITFSYPPPPPPATTRPPVTQYESQGDYVLVGEPESDELPPPPPPRTASLRNPPSRAAPSLPPPPLPIMETLDAQQEKPIIPNVDFGGETDLSLSAQWSEDSTNYPPSAAAKSSGKSPSVQLPPDRGASLGETQLSADDLMAQWGRVGVQVAERATVLFDKSKRALIGDGSYLGFVLAALADVPNAAQPTPPFESFGYLYYAQTGSAVQKRASDVMPGDVIVLHDAKLKGHKGLQSYHQHVGADQPVLAIVTDYDVKKAKVKTFQANQHVGQQSVESVSYRLEDLKSGSIKIFRVLEA